MKYIQRKEAHFWISSYFEIIFLLLEKKKRYTSHENHYVIM